MDEFSMQLSNYAEIESIKSHADDGWRNMLYSPGQKDTLFLGFQHDDAPVNSLTVEFKYTLQFDKVSDRLILDRGHHWYPMIGDQIAKVKLAMEVPDDYIVIASGDLVEKDDRDSLTRFVWQTNIPVFKIPIVIARSYMYEVTAAVDEITGTEIYFYNTSGLDDNLVTAVLAEAGTLFEFYSDRIGEYPHNRLSLVEVPEMQGANIASGLVTIGTQHIEAFKQDYFETVQLVLAQQWIGAGVFGKFMDEGYWFFSLSLPHHLRLMAIKEIRGEEALARELQSIMTQYAKVAGSSGDVPLLEIDLPDTREKGLAVYGKGPYVMDIIRRIIGDGSYWQMIRDIHADFSGRIFTYRDFMSYISKYDPDGTLVTKVTVMLTQPGLPE
ncbi:MAG: hypothetical protein JSV44_05245 [Candidatus Zixiibacteriota bacterium]|nr:MAG: hypothetical protein JSV44_05245 [candidate division Zixibacteria bacterium]